MIGGLLHFYDAYLGKLFLGRIDLYASLPTLRTYVRYNHSYNPDEAEDDSPFGWKMKDSSTLSSTCANALEKK